MDSFIVDINDQLKGILEEINDKKVDYSEKLEQITTEIENRLGEVKNYKEDFYNRKQTIEKMQNDIAGFENDYQKMVDNLKDTELANILVSVNKEVSSKIDERKRMINKDIDAMNEIVDKAEEVKNILVQLKAEKKALELCFEKITNIQDVYSKGFDNLIKYSETGELDQIEAKQVEIKNETKEISFDDEEDVQPVTYEQPKTLDEINDDLLGKTVQLDTISEPTDYTPETFDYTPEIDTDNIEPFTPDYDYESEDMSVISQDELNTQVSETKEEPVEEDEEDIILPNYEDDDATSGFSLDEIQLASDKYDEENELNLNDIELSNDDDDDDSGFSLDESDVNNISEIPVENDETTNLENLINFG